MKLKNRQKIITRQHQQAISAILGFSATIADIKITNVILSFFDTFFTVFPAEKTIADYAGFSSLSVHRTKKKLDKAMSLDWTRKDHAPTPTYFLLLDEKQKERFRILFPLVCGYQRVKIIENKHWHGNVIRSVNKYKKVLLAGALFYSNILPIMTITSVATAENGHYNKCYVKTRSSSAPPDGWFSHTNIFGYADTFDGIDIRPVPSKNPPDWDALLSYNRRPAILSTISRPDYEATTQKYGLVYHKQDDVHERIQSNTRVYPGDRRTLIEQVGTDKAERVSGISDCRSTQGTTTQSKGFKPLWVILQGGSGLLQAKQSRNQLEESRFSQRAVQNARECSDDSSSGYESVWSEIYE